MEIRPQQQTPPPPPDDDWNNQPPPEEPVVTPDFQKLSRRRPTRSQASPVLDRLPPNSVEAEQGVLSCIFQNPNETIPQCIDRLKGGEIEFYDLRHQTIYTVLLEMFDKREEINVITVMQSLKDKQTLEQIGGMSYLMNLPDVAPSAAGVEAFIEILHEKYLLRRVIATCTDVVGKVYDYEGEVDIILDDVEKSILKISEERVVSTTPTTFELVRQAVSNIEEAWLRKGAISGVPTGFADLDRMTNGLQYGDLIIIAGRPSYGKTSLTMNIAEHVAVNLKIPTGVFSVEMTAGALITRMVCSRARVSLRSIQSGFLAERDFPKLTQAAGEISRAPLYIDDAGDLSVLQARTKARRWSQQFGIKLLIIDYLQLMNALHSKRAHEGRQNEVSEIARGVKGLAKELGIPVILISQLNRDLDKETKRKPRLSDLRDSGEIEQTADFVGILYGDRTDEDPDPEVSQVNLWIGKQRNNIANVDVALTFFKTITRFESAARVRDEDVPEAATTQARLPYGNE